MKLRYFLFFVFITGVVSCKKENKYPIVGKWQQVKLRTYTQSYAGAISNDTTYLSSSFNGGNYAQFDNDGICVIGIFYPPGSIDPRSEAAYPSTTKYNYRQVGTKYVLTTTATLINPGGFGEADTAFFNGAAVLIHRVFDSHINYTISDAYYTSTYVHGYSYDPPKTVALPAN
ncbi:MAG: hypothetical protein JSU01_04215 [Bacteroidetes bacterium]|nr:hypothetical protein [Bacteroidota bacterium]